MRITLELKNYRCFPISRPARIHLGPGMTGLIGINNAGKSALIKFFYEARSLFDLLSSPSGNLNAALMNGNEVRSFNGVSDQEEVFSNLNALGLELRFKLHEPEAHAIDGVPVPETIVVKVERGTQRIKVDLEGSQGGVPTDGAFSWSETTMVTTGASNTPLYEFANWFAFFADLRDSLYLGPFRNAIQVGSGQHYDLQIGQGFVNQWDQYRSGSIKRENDAALRLIEEIQAIFGFDRLDITAAQGNDTLQVIIDGKSYRLDEVGAGLAHFVMVLATAAIRKPGFILIDEPELNLHPALQLSFLTTLGGYARRGVVFATHSLGLARAAGSPLYSVRRLSSGDSEVNRLEGTPRLAEFLGELGLSGYQELGFDRVLLVEGPTDVLAVQQFLRLYSADHKIVLLHLGGSATINANAVLQLEEIRRLTSNIYGVVDSERESAEGDPLPRVTKFAETCEQLGIQRHVLQRRALENYLSDRAVKEIKGPKYRAADGFERARDLDFSWGKDENWQIAGVMTRDELDGTDLGEFLEEVAKV